MFWHLRGSGRVFEHAFQMSVFQIRQAVPVGCFRLRFAAGLVGLRFSLLKICITVDTVCLNLIYHFINVWGCRNGWMVGDGFG